MTFLNKYQVAERLQVTTRTIDKWIKGRLLSQKGAMLNGALLV